MSIRLGSLKQRFIVFLIIPLTVLLIVMGAAGFFYVRDLLVDQWREAAILKLQRGAHEVDLRLSRIKKWILMFHENVDAEFTESFYSWLVEHLAKQEGVASVNLSWNKPEGKKGRDSEIQPGLPQPERWQHGMVIGRPFRVRRFHSARIREITPPRFDSHGEHGSVSLTSEFLDERNQVIGQLEVVANFDFIFQYVVESGWWQSNKAFMVDNRGQILVSTVPGKQGMLYDSDDALERATFKAMALAPYGTLPGPGHPPDEISGYIHLQEAPWVLVMIALHEEILAPIIQFRTLYSIFGTGFIVVIIALIRWMIVRITSDIKKISDAMLNLSYGEFGDTLPVRGRDEVAELTRSFNIMTSQLKERLQLKEAISLAQEVQQNLLPVAPPSIAGLDLAGRSIYCQETGGDYFDFIPRSGSGETQGVYIAVADVVGHGISAALLMTTFRALLRCRLAQEGSMSRIACDVNRLLLADTAQSGNFVTLFLLYADRERMALEWVRAGHDPAVYYDSSEDRLDELGGSGMALGIDDVCYVQSSSRTGFEVGDIVLISTDGVWEAENRQSEKFGKARVGELVRRHRNQSAERILQAVLDDLAKFQGDSVLADDVTIVVVKHSDAQRLG